MKQQDQIHKEVQQYYGETLNTSSDLKTNACCTLNTPVPHVKEALKNIHDEVISKYYGCGLVIPEDLEGLKVLDLGSGSGRDCYLMSQLVGQQGQVIGIDMTDAQLDVANRHLEYHRQKFGHQKSNVQFIKGNLDELDKLDLPSNHFDLIISNCVINLCAHKKKVLEECYRLLKEGGEIYFSDVYCNRRLPEHLQKDPMLYGECLSGALYTGDFTDISREVGFRDVRKVESEAIVLKDSELENKVKGFEFQSITYRLFKSKNMENRCEDYGMAVKYKGTLPHSSVNMMLDEAHHFTKGKVVSVCGNTYLMLKESRFQKHFDFYGDFSEHFGLFEDCTPSVSTGKDVDLGGSCC